MTDEDPGSPEFESPLDDLFVDGARYREPSANEREREAREFQRQGKEAARQNRRRRQKTNSRKWLPWAGFAAVVLAVWGLMSLNSGNGDDADPPTTTTTTTTTNDSSSSTVTASPS